MISLKEDEQAILNIIGVDKLLELSEYFKGRPIIIRHCLYKSLRNENIKQEFNRLMTIKEYPESMSKTYRALGNKYGLKERMIRIILKEK
jgi:hypothetical protein